MVQRVLLSQDFLDAVDRHLAAHEPERLLHALGRVRPDGSLSLTHWVPDDEAEASGVHVLASAAAQRRIRAVEQAEGVVYLGVIHSHPANVPEPSRQDGRAALGLLESNPHVPAMVVGVVVSRSTDRRGRHVIRIPRGELALHSVERGKQLRAATASVVALERDFFHGISARLPQGGIEAVFGSHVVVVGAGSLGSVCAEHLVRAGVPQLTLIDPDAVEAANLTRTGYVLEDVGRPKVEALAERLLQINPDLVVRRFACPLQPATVPEFKDVIAAADLSLGLADDQRALAILDTILHEEQTAGVFAGVYRAATGGDIVTVIPGLTACYRCTVAPRVASLDLQPGVDYSTGRLRGEIALGADVAIIAALTSRVALGVLGAIRGTDQLLDRVLPDGRTFLQIGLVPGFFNSTGLFEAVPAQHAFQSIWVRAAGDPACSDCVTQPLMPVGRTNRESLVRRRTRTGNARPGFPAHRRGAVRGRRKGRADTMAGIRRPARRARRGGSIR